MLQIIAMTTIFCCHDDNDDDYDDDGGDDNDDYDSDDGKNFTMMTRTITIMMMTIAMTTGNVAWRYYPPGSRSNHHLAQANGKHHVEARETGKSAYGTLYKTTRASVDKDSFSSCATDVG